MPRCLRITLRISGILVLCLALSFYIRGAYAIGKGDIEVGYNYKGVRMVSNRDSRIALLLAIAGVPLIGNSFPVKDDYKDSS